MLSRTMRPASSAAARTAPPWKWLWQHCLDTQHTSTHSRTFALRVRAATARFPSQPRTAAPSPTKPTPTASPAVAARPSRIVSATPQLSLIDAEKTYQPDTALELLPLVDQLAAVEQADSQWTARLSSAATFETALVTYAQTEQWYNLLALFLEHPFNVPLSGLLFVPSSAAAQLAVEAAMELRDWDKVLRVHVRSLVYDHRRQQRGEHSNASDESTQPASTAKRATKRSSTSSIPAAYADADYRTRACVDCVLYCAYRMGRHDLVQSLFAAQPAPLASSHTTYLLSCAHAQQWQRVEQWLASVDDAVWEEVEMAAVHTAMSTWRLALNQPHSTHPTAVTGTTAHQEQQRYTRSIALVAEHMMRTGALSTPPQPVRWSAVVHMQRSVGDERYEGLPLLVRPVVGYFSPMLISALSITTHHSETDNMAAIISLTLLRMRSHYLSTPTTPATTTTPPPPPIFPLHIQPPHSSLTAWDVDTHTATALQLRGQSAFLSARAIRAVMGGSDRQRRDEARRRDEGREVFESKGERRRRRLEEAAVERGELVEEKQWVLELDVETLQRWLDRTMMPWETDWLSTRQQQVAAREADANE